MWRWQANGSTFRVAGILFCCSLLLGWQAKAQKAQDAESYTLAIVTSDSEYFPIGVAISSLIKLRLLPDHHVDLTTISTGGYSKSLELLLEDHVQFALMDGPFAGGLQAGFDEDSTLRAVTALSSFATNDAMILSKLDPIIKDNHFLATRSDINDDVVYKITKTIFDHLALLRRIDRNTEWITLENASMGLPVRIHEGALRYYREREVSMPALTEFSISSSLERYELPEEARADVNDQTVGILADKRSGGGSTIVADLASVFKDENGLRLISMTSADSLNHLGDLIYREGVDLAIVQADLLDYAREERIYPSLADQVRYIATLFDAEVHLLVSDGIETIEDLKGQRVSLGVDGSTAALTAANAFDELKIPIVHKSLELEQAIVELKTGALSGVVVVGAKPLPELAALRPDDRLTLLSLPHEDTVGLYEPATMGSDDYPGLITPGQTVSTISVPTILATYNWQPGGERYAVVARFVLALFDRLLELKDRGGHPKWQVIDLTDELPGWRRWHPAEAWVQQIVDSTHPLRKATDDDRASNELGAIGSIPTGNKIRRSEEGILVD